MADQEQVDPNSVAALVARCGADRVIDLAPGGDPTVVLVEAAVGLGTGSLAVVARHAASGARRLDALAGLSGLASGFGIAELIELVHGAGLRVIELHGTLQDPVAGAAGATVSRVPAEVVEWVRSQPDALISDLVVVVEVGAPGEIPVLAPAVPETEVRLVDGFTERADRDLRERREVLTVRDHIIGLEATTTAAEDKVALRGRRLREIRETLEKREAEVERLRARVRTLEARAGTPAEEPGSAVRRAARRLRHH